VASQVELLAGMGEGYESEFILYSLADFEQAAESIEIIVAAWRAGDMAGLEALFVDDMRERSPALYDTMLVQRNNNWMPTIESLIDGDQTALVLVGAAHLVGEHGLLEQLQARGFTVRPK